MLQNTLKSPAFITMGLIGLVLTLGAPVFDYISGSRVETFNGVITAVEQPRKPAASGGTSTQRIFAIRNNGGEKEPIFLCVSGCPFGQQTIVAPASLTVGAAVQIETWRTMGNRLLALNIKPQSSVIR